MKKSRKQRPINESRSRLLHQLKAQNRLTIVEIASRVGVSQTLISDYLAGEEMFLSDAVALAELLGITLDDLVCRAHE